MFRLLCAMSLVSIMYARLPAIAASTPDPRQVRDCMSKRMSLDRAVSYNEAKRECAARLKVQNQTPSAPLAAAGAGAGR